MRMKKKSLKTLNAFEQEDEELDAPQKIEDEDDEIDSDEAMNSSDEERFAGFKFYGSKSKKLGVKPHEEEEEEEEGTGVPISELADINSGEEDNSSDVEETLLSVESDADEDGADLLENLHRATLGKENKEGRPVTDAQAPPSYGLVSSEKLKLTDIIPTISDARIRHAVSKLQKGSEFAAPLVQRQQNRIDREAAYDLAKKEVSKWQETVKRNREADHLIFPLEKQTAIDLPATSNTIASTTKPETHLEQEIERILKDSGMTDERDIATFENLETAPLDAADVAQRRAELRKTRDLMLRQEMKAKRINKIKSKSYHRVRKHERLRNERKEQLTYGPDDDEMVRQRAAERMSLRHRNAGKWAKRMVQRGATDPNARQALVDQLERGDKLRKKIQGESDVDSGRESPVESDSEAPERGGLLGMKFMRVAAEKEKKENLKALEQLDDTNDESDAQSTEHVDNRIERNAGRLSFAPAKGMDFGPSSQNPKDVLNNLSSAPSLVVPQTGTWETIARHKPAKSPNPNVDERKVLSESGQILRLDGQPLVDDEAFLNMTYGASKNGADQDELIRQAFGGDDVVEDFTKEKRKVVEEDAPHDEDVTLPGWGAWIGRGTKKTKRRVFEHVPGVEKEKRKDAKLKHVIINEKRTKKNAKFTASQLPHPFETKEQYERSLRLPIGKEWTTIGAHQKMTKPRILLKQGQIIDPMTEMLKS